jgi:TonB family protein
MNTKTIIRTVCVGLGLLLPLCSSAQQPVWRQQAAASPVWQTPPAPIWRNTPVRYSESDDGESYIMVNEEAKPVNLAELKVAIQYPQMAQDVGITGQVVLRLVIDEQGRYIRHTIARSPHPWLTQAVELQIAKLRFTPAIVYGNPVSTEVVVPFNFTLNQ